MARTYKKNRKKLSPLDKAYKSYSIQFSKLGNQVDELGNPIYTALGRRIGKEEFESWVVNDAHIDLNDTEALLKFARARAARDYTLLTTEEAKNLKRELLTYLSEDELTEYFGLTRADLKNITVADLRQKAYADKKLLKNYYHYLKEKKGKTAEDAAATISAEIFGS